MDDSEFTVGIVGGTGKMGQWFQRFFSGAGYRVEIAGRKTPISPAELARKSKVLIVTVPISDTPRVIKEVGGYLPKDALLMDFTSLKKDAVEAMLEFSDAEVIGTHPLFGPGEKSLKGQNIILCPARGDKWLPWLKSVFTSGGAHLEIMSPEEHDRAMAYIQGLLHSVNMAMGMAVRESSLPFAQLKGIATPNFRKKIKQVKRLFRQEPELYTQMFFHNPYAIPALKAYMRQFETLIKAIESKNPTIINEIFTGVGSYLSRKS